jgi:hypothetical protein
MKIATQCLSAIAVKTEDRRISLSADFFHLSGCDVMIGSEICLERFQAQPKWEIPRK